MYNKAFWTLVVLIFAMLLVILSATPVLRYDGEMVVRSIHDLSGRSR